MTIIHGDSLIKLKELPENSIDAVVTDPPYGLSFMGKKWDYDVPSVGLWREVLRVLKPGGHVLSFGGTRTYHRMVVNMEDAGFEIRDQVQWIYGSGFPKSLNLKGEWQGFGTALKPANEPICLARKPLSEKTVAENVLKWGCGAINVDGSRISYANEADKRLETRGVHVGKAYQHEAGDAFKKEINKVAEVNHQGRWPANLLLDETAAEMLDAQSGTLKSGQLKQHHNIKARENIAKGKEADRNRDKDFGGDSGGASRFFYVAKASKRERNAGLGDDKCTHPTVKPIRLMEYLIKLITPPNGTVLDPFMGSGSTGVACKNLGFEFLGIELNEEYVEIAKRRIDV